jgi:hypothetical protein
MGAKFYLDSPILLTKAGPSQLLHGSESGFFGSSIQVYTPRPPSPKVSQNPNSSESNRLPQKQNHHSVEFSGG